jgi:hypothetical protein
MSLQDQGKEPINNEKNLSLTTVNSFIRSLIQILSSLDSLSICLFALLLNAMILLKKNKTELLLSSSA